MAKAQTNDFTKTFENMFANVPTDMKVFNNAFTNAVELGSKLSKIALIAAEKNAEISSAWTKETLTKLEGASVVQKEAADYAKVASDFASSQAQTSPEHIAAFAEVAKKAQMETIELMMALGKDAQDEVAEVVKEATAAVKKATAA